MIDNENMDVSGNPRAFYNRSEYGQGFTSENGRNWTSPRLVRRQDKTYSQI